MIATTLAGVLAFLLAGSMPAEPADTRAYSDCLAFGIQGALYDPTPVEAVCDEALQLPDLSAEQRAGSLLIRAMARLVDGRQHAAIGDLNHAYALSNSDPISLVTMGQLFESLQAYGRALVLYNWVLQRYPDRSELLERRALVLDRLENPPSALIQK